MKHTIANLVFVPNPTPERLQIMRNMLTCQFESARTIAAEAPFGANMMLELAVHGMLQYHFWRANHTIPHDAEFHTTLAALDQHLGQLAHRFKTETDFDVRWSLAEQIAARTLQPQPAISEST